MTATENTLRISVVVPSFNQARFLRECLESIVVNDADEILVFDGGSTDGSLDILREYDSRISWVSGPDGGQTRAINQGLRKARGEILCYLNSDDVFFPDVLARVRRCFAEDPSRKIIYGNALHLNEDGSPMEPYPTEEWNFARLLDRCFICQPAAFWRRDVHAEFGLFDESLNFAMDYEYWLRAGARVPFFHLDGLPLAGSRLHAETKTLSCRAAAHREMLEVVRRHTDKPYRWLTTLAKILEQEPPESLPKAYDDYGPHTAEYFSQIFRLAHEYRIPLDDAFCKRVAVEMIRAFGHEEGDFFRPDGGLLERAAQLVVRCGKTIFRQRSSGLRLKKRRFRHV